MRITSSPRHLLVSLLAVALLAAGCGSGGGGGEETTAPAAETGASEQAFSVSVASYDIAVSQEKRRFIVGLQAPDQHLISGGSVEMTFSYLGDREQQVENPEPSITATGEYLPVPGTTAPEGGPKVTTPSEARGVYGAQVAFDQAGFWSVEVAAGLEGEGAKTGTANFEVLAEPQVPDVGDPALKTENRTMASVKSGEVEAVAVDSRAQEGKEIPDPELHDATIAEAVAAGRPAVVTFSTPVYCRSQFCGPITDMIADLAGTYGDKAEFIHVEIWNNFQEQAINKAAADWLLRNNNLQEPWVFVIGADGKITHRFANLTTRGELEPILKAL